jgi:hypothetical protein
MPRRSVVALVLVIALAATACERGADARSGTASPTLVRAPSVTPTPTPASTPVASGAEPFVPAAHARIPLAPARAAEALERVTRAVRGSIDAWVRSGGTSTWPPPTDLVLQGLYQQRIYRLLAQRSALARRVLARLGAGTRREAGAIVRANTDIFVTANPVPPSYSIRTRPPEPAATLLRDYRIAERRFGVDWELLAAVNYVESKFGRVVSNSSAGAQGPMQFLPSTWRAYGLGGDVHDPRDAILGAANYLRANGAPARVRRALFAYNRSWSYVARVKQLARRYVARGGGRR